MSYAAPVVVIDCGSTTTRLGFAGNAIPTYTLPSTSKAVGCSTAASKDQSLQKRCVASTPAAAPAPVERGAITNWDAMEDLLRSSFDDYLCIEPEETAVVFAEPPLTSPRDRERIAEVFFECYGVCRLYFGAPSLLALRSSCIGGDDEMPTTALVVESSTGVTQATPVVDGYMLQASVQQMMVGGEDISAYLLESLREHERCLDGDDALAVAEAVKVSHTYTAKDMVKEMALFDSNLPKYIIRHALHRQETQRPCFIEVGYERFLAPEALFRPELMSGCPAATDFPSLPDCIDTAVWSCPIDCRRRLYTNILLSGGNTMFPKLPKRLNKELQYILGRRAQGYMEASGSMLHRAEYEVNVIAHPLQYNAVWCGGSVIGASADFTTAAKDRQAYTECGPSILSFADR